MPIPNALTIAGSDSGGGAGIQADLKTFSALGVFGCSVISALTAQNTVTVSAVHAVPASFVRAQLDAVLADIKIDAVKIGMLGTAEIVEAIADELRKRSIKNVVVDPVMIAKSGAKLLSADCIDVLVKELLPQALIITPNIHEAAALLRTSPEQIEHDLESACRALADFGCANVVLKGGHLSGPSSDDLLYDGRTVRRFCAARIATNNTHGTGCTFSSAIAAYLARGAAAAEAVSLAKDYISRAILHADRLCVGSGHGPVNHFFSSWQTE